MKCFKNYILHVSNKSYGPSRPSMIEGRSESASSVWIHFVNSSVQSSLAAGRRSPVQWLDRLSCEAMLTGPAEASVDPSNSWSLYTCRPPPPHPAGNKQTCFLPIWVIDCIFIVDYIFKCGRSMNVSVSPVYAARGYDPGGRSDWNIWY